MLNLLRKLLGIDSAPAPPPAPAAGAGRDPSAGGGRTAAVGRRAPGHRAGHVERHTQRGAHSQARSAGGSGADGARADDAAVHRYFELATEIEQAKSDRHYPRAVRAARATYPILPAVARQWRREFGSFDISTSHAVHTAPTLMAVLEDAEGIRELRAALEGVRELREWLPAAEEAEADLELVPRIMAVVRVEPGLLQSSLKTRLGVADGARPSQLAAWLEKAGRLYRVKKGSSYQLYPAGYVIPTAATPAPTAVPSAAPTATSPRASSSPSSPSSSAPASASPTLAPASTLAAFSSSSSPPPAGSAPGAGAPTRPGRAAAKARLLDFSGLPVVRLPMAPAAWEERNALAHLEAVWAKGVADAKAREEKAATRKQGKESRTVEPKFVVEGDGWTIAREEKLAPADRPDPAYREVFHTGRYTHWLDPKGRREGFEYAASVLRVTDREGRVVAERGLAHDAYRSDVNADGTGILFLSREGVLHGYTETLAPVLEERVLDFPEYRAQAERLGIEPRELKNHMRCVAIAADRSRYLVTVVDEAWCLETTTGDVVWGFRMPTKEGWTRRVAERSARAGTSAEVEAALQLMGLELPVTPEDVIRQYRSLAMRWHPDRNLGDPGATARFQELGAAMELLTGADLSQLSGREVERVTYEQVLSTTRISVPDGRGGHVEMSFSVGLGVSEKFAADWIYAANLGRDGRAFLAGYSGKVVVVSPRGIPERVYDVGAVPRHIVDAGEHLYILTDTRLYVLAGDRLEALVDVYGAGEVVVADHGFALLEPKAITWFTPAGRKLGAIRTKDPLRRAFSTTAGLVVETRQHRGVVTGAPPWWRA